MYSLKKGKTSTRGSAIQLKRQNTAATSAAPRLRFQIASSLHPSNHIYLFLYNFTICVNTHCLVLPVKTLHKWNGVACINP